MRTNLDVWDDGSAYEAYVGRWSQPVAAEFIQWLGIAPSSGWLDFGCGTGALTRTILAHASPSVVVGCDRSADFTEFARRQTADARAQFVVAGLDDLPRVDGGFDACVAGLVLNFLPDPAAALGALALRTRDEGTLAAYVWDYSEGMGLIRVFWDAAVALNPAARELDEGVRFPLCRRDTMRTLFADAGLRDVDVRSIDVPTVFRDFDDYWRPFLGGQGPAPGYAMSLSEEARNELRDAIQLRLPRDAAGRIPMTARAWAARGRV